MAAESYLDGGDLDVQSSLEKFYVQGANHYLNYADLKARGELGMTQATRLMWSDFSDTWELIAHQKNTSSGFSGTLLLNRLSGEYTLSFRSTESKGEVDGGDARRDSALGANGEISADGFAWGQIRDMRGFFEDLSTAGSAHYDPGFAAHMAGGGRVNVTGYSLGGHLAQVFVQLNSAAVLHAYTFNGAGMGALDSVAEGQPLGSQLAVLMSMVDATMERPSEVLELFDGAILNRVALGFGHIFSPTLGNAEKLQWFVDQDSQWKDNESEDSSIYENPLYQVAVAHVETETTGTFLQGVWDLFGDSRREYADSRLSNIYGHAVTGDEEFVATSGQRFGSPREIFIEDQANTNDVELIASLLDDERSYVDDITELWGDTHSITLIIDTLYVADLIQRLDPAIGLQDILEKILPASSNDKAAGYLDPNPDDVEANSHEHIVNALGNLYLPDVWVDILQIEADDAFGDIEHRNRLHDAIDKLRVEFASRAPLASNSIELLTDLSVEELYTVALRDDSPRSIGYRYALTNLMPFAVVSTLAGTAAEDPRYELENASEQYFRDRSLMLYSLLDMNASDNDHGPLVTRIKFENRSELALGNIVFDGDASGYPATEHPLPQTYDNLRARYIFGAELDETSEYFEASDNADHLYGMGGNDILKGLAGSDYLEGGAGDDKLWGGNDGDQISGGPGDDRLTGGAGNDYLVGGAGADRFFWKWGHGVDVIGDYDDAGDRVIVNDIDLSTLHFERISASSSYYKDNAVPEISLHYDGDFLTASIDGDQGSGSVILTQYLPALGADYGLVLHDYAQPPAPVSDVTVSVLGASNLESDNQVRWNAYDRQHFLQRGLDWSVLSINFDAAAVVNYNPGGLHGTLGGAFEGGPQADSLTGESGANALHGLGGDDRISGLEGDDFLEGGAGSDTLIGGEGNDLIFGGARAGLSLAFDSSSAYGQFYLAEILDLAGDSNRLDGGDGEDGVSGGEYADYIEGGPGNDYLLGGAGADYISGGADRDVIYGDSSLHYRYVELEPGVASERIEIAFADGLDSSGRYDDVIHAGGGSDTVWGELGDDELHGGDGDDNLIGDRYNDTAYFAAELPAFTGTSPEMNAGLHGSDRLYGGAGGDLLLGLGGDDFLAGGIGADSLLGGAGDDTYSYHYGDGLDHIEDTEGFHTLLFTGVPLAELQVIFQGDQVFVGTANGSDGFYLAKSEWPNVRIAVGTADGVIERSQLDTLYFDGVGNLLLTVKGVSTMPEAERDALFTVDASNSEDPRIIVSALADDVEIEGLDGGSGGASMRVVGGGLPFVIEFTAMQLETGLDFLSLADGLLMSLVGFSGNVFGSESSDHIIGSGGPDTLRGEAGSDILEGRGGNDTLEGGDHDDELRGGRGNDLLDGGLGDDIYAFAVGDGHDRLEDPAGGSRIQFDAGVSPESVVLYYTDTSADHFRIEYGQSDSVTSEGTFASHWIESVTVGNSAIPLVHRSDLEDGTFHNTRGVDVYETGAGNDTIFHSNWSGADSFRFLAGDGQDTIVVNGAYFPYRLGTIRLGADVDLESLSYKFSNGTAEIAYGGDDQITLISDSLYSPMDNTFTRFSLVSEANPYWIPLIRSTAPGGNTYGTLGADRIVGNAHSETFVPGYGDDVIEAGEGADRILLNDVYIESQDGIGKKHIWGEGSNDIVETPLHQGLTFYYNLGDGNDTIIYDWSKSSRHPYDITSNAERTMIFFHPYGQDTLVFGEGITLTDLRFLRLGNALSISLLDDSGGIRLEEFFHALDFDPASWDGDASDLFENESEDASINLLHPAYLSAMPKSPVTTLRFADGSVYDMVSVLEALLEFSNATLLGTEGDDSLTGTDGDDVIHALGGDDFISDFGGNNIVLAGAGNDYILLGSDSLIDPGPGDDGITLPYGDHIIQFGPGGGSDSVAFQVNTATVEVELATGVTLDDVVFSMADSLSGPAPLLTLAATRDELLLEGVWYDSETGESQTLPGSPGLSLRFADGTFKTGSEIYTLAQAAAGVNLAGTIGDDVLTGTPGNDTIIGGKGNDFMDGGAGDDTFLIDGPWQGWDTIVGGEGFDTVTVGEAGEIIRLAGLLEADSIERIDGGPGWSAIYGSGAGNTLNFSATELQQIVEIQGRGGRDEITGSTGRDVINGGKGNDTLSGGGGSDCYFFATGDGHDVINNADDNPDSFDYVWLDDIAHDDVWLSRKYRHLYVNIVGTAEQIVIKDWYRNDADQLDAIFAVGQVLMRDQVDQLVNAMASFSVPIGVGSDIPDSVRLELEPVLAEVWEPVVSFL